MTDADREGLAAKLLSETGQRGTRPTETRRIAWLLGARVRTVRLPKQPIVITPDSITIASGLHPSEERVDVAHGVAHLAFGVTGEVVCGFDTCCNEDVNSLTLALLLPLAALAQGEVESVDWSDHFAVPLRVVPMRLVQLLT